MRARSSAVKSRSHTGPPPSGAFFLSWVFCRLTTPSFFLSFFLSGEYDGVVHAVGMLFAGRLNRFASGSGSVPDPGTTYDKITRQTAFAATAALEDLAKDKGGAQVKTGPCAFYW